MNKTDKKDILSFSIIVIAALAVSYFIHSEALKNYFQLSAESLPKAYIFNGLYAIGAFILLVFLKKKHESSFGFIFIGTGFLKFIFFFVAFYPTYTLDGSISRAEFFEFFTPYLLCLFLEVYFLIKILMRE